MGRAGFLCTAVDPAYGGRGGDFRYSVIALEEVARTNHYGLDAFLHSDIVVPYIEAYGSREQKENYLPGCVQGDIITAIAMTEPDAGSDLAAMVTTAEEVDGTVTLDGTKTFISNGVICDLVVVAAKDPTADRPHKAISLYLVEAGTPGFEKGPAMEKLGVRSQDTNELYFSKCRIPAANRLGEKGDGFKMLMAKLQQERLLVAMQGLTRAAFCFHWTLDHFRGTTGASNKETADQATRFALAEMATGLTIGHTFLDTLIVDHMAGKNVVEKISMAKYWLTDLANQVCGRALELLGTRGLSETCPIVRTFRDVRVMPIFAGTNEIMKTIIAKDLFVGEKRS
jgi:alkylation response protein AidB-like acyl-CoA dehydrogenase